MTDPSPQPPVDEDEGAGFHIVPDAELYLRLERRVGELERAGGGDSRQLRTDLRAVSDRLGRHREELEAIKTSFGLLVEYVRQTLPASAPAPTSLEGGFL